MNNSDLIYKPLTELARIERSQKNKIYTPGTIYVQVSACKKNTTEIWNILLQNSHLEDKYAAVIANNDINPFYLLASLEQSTETWYRRYVGSSINISMDLFQYLYVGIHKSKDVQNKIVKFMELTTKMADKEQEMVNTLKDAKKTLLSKMLI